MSKSLYVGNLPYNATSDDLQSLFEEHGTVARSQVIMDRESGRSKGFGFVEMEDGGEDAIDKLNGSQFQGRTLTVNEARPRESSGGGQSNGSGYNGNRGGMRRF